MVKKKNDGRGAVHSTMEIFFRTNILSVLSMLELGWNKVLQLHNGAYTSKMQTVELLHKCFTTLYRSKISTGSHSIPPEVNDVKMA
eukprot:10655511-Ditylum_brightwellii.AAC.1